MSNTSSSSAGGTTEGPGQDQTGRLSIESKNVRISPDEAEAVLRDFRERHGDSMERMSDWAYLWWMIVVNVRHWFGIHTLIVRERWVKKDGLLRIDKVGETCWKCEYTE